MIKGMTKGIFKSFLENRILSRWFVLCIDIIIIFCVSVISYFIALRVCENVQIPEHHGIIKYLAITMLVNLFFLLLMKTYQGIIRYSTIHELLRIFVTLSLAIFSIYMSMSAYYGLSIKMTFVYCGFLFLMSLIGLCGFRLTVVIIYQKMLQLFSKQPPIHVYIWGYDEGSIALSQETTIGRHKFRINGFVTNDYNSQYYKSANLPIFIIDEPEDLIKYNVKNILITSDEVLKDQRDFIGKMVSKNINIYVTQQMNISNISQLSEITHHIRPIQIEDLLGRPEIEISMDTIANNIEGKIILVTGAAGSIGSEIVRQLGHFNPHLIVCLDQAETPLNELNFELNKCFSGLRYVSLIGDVRNQKKMSKVFATYKPDIVYHAAAYKHVPMMEKDPCEAVMTNIYGTRLIVDLSIENNVEMFVMISTDKAVNPTNIMGTTKRIAEIYTQSCATDILKNKSKTKFVTTRFGNVLGSNGSVIPLFRKQIENGGPITVTHPEITRFFMTIPEACCLVLEASVIGKSGYIYVFDMGEPVKIYDLAQRMIELAGLVSEKDIKIEFSGLRPGEKLYEEVLNNSEICESTSHEKIMMAKVRKFSLNEVLPKIEKIISSAIKEEKYEMVSIMKELVPEFISNNSDFEDIDKRNREKEKVEESRVYTD